MSKLGEIFTPEGRPAGHVAYSEAAFNGSVNATSRPVVVQPHPFRREVLELTVPEGASLQDMVDAAAITRNLAGFVRVSIEDQEIDQRFWGQVRPKAGRQVYIRVVPQGGGDGGRKNVMASVLMVAVAVAAAWAGPFVAGTLMGLAPGTVGFAMASGVVGAGVSMLGALLVSALIPPPDTTPEVGQRALLSGVRNRLQPYATIPRIFGRRRVYPLQAARPYTEAAGKSRWVRVLLCVGYGPLAISQIKIGDTPIGFFNNIEYEVREGWRTPHANFGSGSQPQDPRHKLFTQSVREETFSQLLSPNVWVERTTDINTEEASVDLTAPQGICNYESDGDKKTLKVECEVQWRKTGSSDAWTSVAWDGNDEPDGTQTNGKVILEDDGSGPLIRGGRWEFPSADQYTVRVRRITANADPEDADRVEWTALRSITADYPVQEPGVATIALKIKLTDNFTSIPDTINCVAESYLPVWNGTSWAWAITRNPAWAFADVLRRRGIRWQIRDSRIDLAGLSAWALAADAAPPQGTGEYWRYDAIMESGSVWQALRRIASHARANYVLKDGQHSVVRDIEQATPVQHITPRNSWGYRGTKAFVDLPHALKVQFVNAAQGWQEDEVIVYAPGYDETTADRFESLELPDCTAVPQAQREGKYHLAVGKYRAEEHSVYMDIEHLRCTMGDRVQFAHDVISVGISSGRIVSRITDGSGNVTGLELESEVAVTAGQSYALRARLSGGTVSLFPLATPGSSGTVSTVTLATPIPAASASTAPGPGDLYTFGRTSLESVAMIIKKIEPGPDFTALITMVAHDISVNQSDSGTLPDHTPVPAGDTPADQQRPANPAYSVSSGNEAVIIHDDGTVVQRIQVAIRPAPSGSARVTAYSVQVRSAGIGNYRHVNGSPGDDTVLEYFYGPVKKGELYDIRVKAHGENGTTSDWMETLAYAVVGRGQQPPKPLNLVADPGVRQITLSWDKVVFSDLEGYDVYEALAATPAPDFNTPASFQTGKGPRFIRTGLPDSATRHYWVRGRTYGGVVGPWSDRAQATTYANLGVTPEILDGLISETAFANGITAPLIVDTLPTTGNYEGRLAYLTSDGKLYRYHAGAWTRATDGADLVADSVTTGKIAAGAIGAQQIAASAVTAEKLLLIDQENLIPVGAFEEGSTGPFVVGAGVAPSFSSGGTSGARALVLDKNSDTSAHFYVGDNYLARCRGNEWFWLETEAREHNGGSYVDAINILLRFYDANKVYIGGSSAGIFNFDLTGSYITRTAQVQAPSSARYVGWIINFNAGISNAAAARVDRVVVRRANAAQLIVDGGIVANHVSTNEIITNAANIRDAIISGAKIKDLAVSTLKIGKEAVTVARSAYTPNRVDPASGSYKTLASFSLKCESGYVTDLFASCVIVPLGRGSGSDRTYASGNFISLWNGGTKLREWTLKFGEDDMEPQLVTLMMTDAKSYSGGRTFALKYSGTTSAAYAKQSFLRAQQVKR